MQQICRQPCQALCLSLSLSVLGPGCYSHAPVLSKPVQAGRPFWRLLPVALAAKPGARSQRGRCQRCACQQHSVSQHSIRVHAAQALFQPDGGILASERCIRAHVERASAHGARIHTSCQVPYLPPWVEGSHGVEAVHRTAGACRRSCHLPLHDVSWGNSSVLEPTGRASTPAAQCHAPAQGLRGHTACGLCS